MNIYYHVRKNVIKACMKFLKNDNLFEASIKSKETISFIQIGANDGVQSDNLNQFISSQWSGLLIEPIPHYYEKLINNYKHFSANLKFVNCAVSDAPGVLEIYYINPRALSTLPIWVHGLGTTSKFRLIEHVESFFESRIHLEREIEKKTVPTFTFEQIAIKYNLIKIDLLAIDTEGHDFVILNSINYGENKIGIILFEFKHMKLMEIAKIFVKLKLNGYIVKFHSADDIIAVSKKWKGKNL